MKNSLMQAAVVCCYYSAAVMADVWQETVAGTLQLQPATNLQAGCAAGNSPSILSKPFSGHPLYNRVQFNAQHFSFSADAAAPLQIVPQQIVPKVGLVSTAASLHSAYWGIQSTTVSRGKPVFRLYWQDEAGKVVRAARLTLSPLHWQPEWTASYQSSVTPWLSEQLTPQSLADDPTSTWLLLPGDAQVPIRLFNADSGLPRQLSLPATAGTFGLLPLAADADQDGLAERLYLLSQQGVLWQYDWQAGNGWRATQLADLQKSGWDFSGSLQRFAARWQSATGWQEGDVFVVLARAGADHRLLVLRRADNVQTPLTFADVAVAPDLTKAGWYAELAEAPLTPAKVLAGVLYLPLKADTGCIEDAAYDQILALQLYSGAVAYCDPVLRLAQPQQAPLRLMQTAQQLQLWSGSVPVVSQLVTLNPACLMCTELLTPQHLQGQQIIAVFRREQVY
jgi:hypothetical protein